MIGLSLLLALPAWPAAAPAPEPVVAGVFQEVDALRRAQENQDARTIAELERRIDALGARLAPLGAAAVPELERRARDGGLDEKTRWRAAAWIAATRDPGGFGPLKRLLLDPGQPELVRREAARGLAGAGAGPRALRAALDAALADDDLPLPTLHQTLLELGRLGSDEPRRLGRWARRLEKRREPLAAAALERCLRALARSRSAESARELFELFAVFSTGSQPRAWVLEALRAEPAGVKALGAEGLARAAEALEREARSARAAEAGIELLALLEARGATPLLARFLDHESPRVLAAAAESLAALGAVQARPKLERVLAGAAADPRFGPGDDGREAIRLYNRLEAALESLSR